jgi:glyoxylase I family protein
MPAIDVLGIEHIDLTVSDLPRSEAFYDKVMSALGFRRIEDADPRWANALMTIAIRPAADDQRQTAFNRYRAGLHHLAFKAISRADVDEFHHFVLAEGIELLDAPSLYPEYGENYYAMFIADPDGMKLEVAHFPWGYWRRAQTGGRDERARYSPRSSR